MSAFEGPAIVELLGHRIVAGIAQEVELAGAQLLRVDVALPDDRSWPQFYTSGAIYALTPATVEQIDELWRRRNEATLASHNLLPPEELARYRARQEAEAEAYRARYSLSAPVEEDETGREERW